MYNPPEELDKDRIGDVCVLLLAGKGRKNEAVESWTAISTHPAPKHCIYELAKAFLVM